MKKQPVDASKLRLTRTAVRPLVQSDLATAAGGLELDRNIIDKFPTR